GLTKSPLTGSARRRAQAVSSWRFDWRCLHGFPQRSSQKPPVRWLDAVRRLRLALDRYGRADFEPARGGEGRPAYWRLKHLCPSGRGRAAGSVQAVRRHRVLDEALRLWWRARSQALGFPASGPSPLQARANVRYARRAPAVPAIG